MTRSAKTVQGSLRDAGAVARRQLVLLPCACVCTAMPAVARAGAELDGHRWMQAAQAMREQALSWGDQAYGAVLVKNAQIIGFGPSRVVRNRDPDAHAEREAIKHALGTSGPAGVRGATLYSTSRPCDLCESAAARVGIARMVFGADLRDAGAPRAR